MVNARNKGATGERELCRWIKDNLGVLGDPERNLEQVRSGGADIINVYPFIFEVKRVENLDLVSWWIQVKTAWEQLRDMSDVDEQAGIDRNLIPVVAFRQNNQPWEFLIHAGLIGNNLGFLRLNEKTFKEWALNELAMYGRDGATSMFKGV